MALIRVLNPNSNTQVTAAIAAGLRDFEIPGKVDIICETLETGPIGIETERHVAEVAIPTVDHLAAHSADAHVIACYSDPGLALARAELDTPVFGVMESAVMLAATRGARFGVVALSEPAIKRHLRALAAMGMLDRLAAERAVGVSVAESAGEEALHNLTQTARDLRDQDGADVVILGCAGMARHRGAMEAKLGIPVIDPSQAAVATALAAILPK